MRQSYVAILLFIAIAVVCFIPVLSTSLYSDDIHNFQLLNAHANKAEVPIIKNVIAEIELYTTWGRFTPCTVSLQSLVYYNVDTVKDYKIFQFSIAILAVLAFGFYVYSLNVSINLAILGIGLLATVQFRAFYHDPFISINGMYPFIAITIFMALGLYAHYIRTYKKVYYFGSLLFFLIALLSSEVGFIVAILLPLTAWVLRVPVLRLVKTCAPFGVITLAILAYILYLRSHAVVAYGGLQSNADVNLASRTFGIQFFGGLPLSTLYRQKAIPAIVFSQWHNTTVIFTSLATIILGLLAYVSGNVHKGGRVPPRFLTIAFTLMIVPALIIMTSQKYQQEMKMGMAYLPVLFQYFGVAALLSFVFQWLYQSANRYLHAGSIVLLLACMVSGIMTIGFNQAVIDRASYQRGQPAEAMYEAVKKGILSDCPSGSNIILTHDFVWRAPIIYQSMFNTITGKSYYVNDLDMWQPPSSASWDGQYECFELDCEFGNPIKTTLYKRDCVSGKRIQQLRQFTTECNITLTEQQKAIVYDK